MSVSKQTPLKAIRSKCIQCTIGNPAEIIACSKVDCPLYNYRTGKYLSKNLNNGGEISSDLFENQNKLECI